MFRRCDDMPREERILSRAITKLPLEGGGRHKVVGHCLIVLVLHSADVFLELVELVVLFDHVRDLQYAFREA